MLRLLAEVKSHELKRRYSGAGGLEYGRYRVRVKIRGSALTALKVPDRFVGREVTLRRDFMMPWGVKKGDLLVLDQKESARVVGTRRSGAGEDSPPAGRVAAESADVNRDGYAEDVVANAFASAVVQPHRGARLVSLTDPSGSDRFAQPFDHTIGGRYILLGGAEAAIAEGGTPGEIWKSAFEREEVAAGGDRAEIAYERALKSPEGVTLGKVLVMEPDLPGVLERYSVFYAGNKKERENPGAEDAPEGASGRRKDETNVTLVVRMTTPVLGLDGSRNVFDVPSSSGIRTVRYHRPGFGRRWRWRDWRDEHFGMAGGFVLSRHEELGNVLAILFNARRASHLSVRSDYTGPEVSILHAPRKLRKGRRAEFGVAFLVGESVARVGGSMLMVSRGRRSRGRIPLALTLRTGSRLDRVRVAVSAGRGRRAISLTRRDLPEIGAVWTRVIDVAPGELPATFAATVRGDRLSVTVEE